MKKYTFGEKVKKLAKQKGISLRELSKRSGLSYNTLAALTSGRALVPTLVTAVLLSKFFRIKMDELIKDVSFEKEN